MILTAIALLELKYCNTCYFSLQTHEGEWGKTIISYDTDKPVRLPIIDVALRDIGKSDQSFYVEIGAACYE